MRAEFLNYMRNFMFQFIEGVEYHEWCWKPRSPGHRICRIQAFAAPGEDQPTYQSDSCPPVLVISF